MPDVVVVIGSHGGLEAARVLLGCLPLGFPATMLLDLHRGGATGRARDLLARRSSLPLREARGGLTHKPGAVYLAPCDCSVLMTENEFVGICGTGSSRPWHRFVDVLLTDAAHSFGPRLLAIILSGHLDGGAFGARAVRTFGGRVLVQAPESALAPSMPSAALSTGCVDFALPPESLGSALVALCGARGAAELFRARPIAAAAS